MNPIAAKIAEELNVPPEQVASAIALLDEGATVPFIARYRKEVTGGLDDTQLRTLEERLHYLRELEERRAVILQSIADQGKLTEPLEAAIRAADTKTRLEDLYLPYKPKRRTKAQIAREAGLAPLAGELLSNPEHDPETLAQSFVNPEKGVPDTKAALEGARHILMEDFAEAADLLGWLREYLWNHGMLCARVIEGREQAGLKFQDYFDYQEPIRKIPSHRALALFRGRNEQVLQLDLILEDEKKRADSNGFNRCEKKIAAHFGIREAGRPADAWLLDVVRRAWRVKISIHLEVELLMRLREAAEEVAIEVFAANLKDLLMAAPAGSRATMGLDPGLRTGVKVAVVDATGKRVAHTTVYPHPPRKQWDVSIRTLSELIQEHEVTLISIGNGTASRETDKLGADLMAQHPEWGLTKVMVSEAGASVYSASATAAQEFPDLDVVFRGAVSIARRLQDPLAELVKIEPKSIGVGQYQHDVRQSHLARSLDTVVEDCVNAVGVAVNTASIPLLAHVSGLNEGLARNIVAHRDQHGPFLNRQGLKSVPRLGLKTFEQSAGFLRIPDGDHPLDASAVHPEAYPVVKRILTDVRKDIRDVIGDRTFLKGLDPERYSDATFGLPTVVDIIRELEKPGRDPRPEFHTAQFKEGVETLQDLREGMILEGVVTNVTHFGAFVDIGVHQDGLAHISELANRFVKDPRDVVKTGGIVRVRVLKVDPVRRRIALSMRLNEGAE
ncbi:MAG: RNA-binding transcriptional accessory protein [Candidatus Latescibacteria bacterium]|nr:RNA-binding transcriptional accessory protein [Candidatus Latescibacterota bacterium]